ncbi:hypothetical protein D3C74_196690 [compost metagenome]
MGNGQYHFVVPILSAFLIQAGQCEGRDIFDAHRRRTGIKQFHPGPDRLHPIVKLHVLHGLQPGLRVAQGNLQLPPEFIAAVRMAGVNHPQPRVRCPMGSPMVFVPVLSRKLQLHQAEARFALLPDPRLVQRICPKMKQPHILLLGYLQYQM